MLLVIDFLQQLLGQWQNLVERMKFLRTGRAAGYLTEVVKLNLQRQRIPLEVMTLQPACQFHCYMIQFDDYRRTAGNVLLQRMLATYRLTDAHRLDRTQIDASGKVVINAPHLAKFLRQHRKRTGTKLFAVVYAQQVHLLGCDRPYSPETFDRQTGNEVECLVGMNGTQSVGLAVVGSNLGQKFVVGNTG